MKTTILNLIREDIKQNRFIQQLNHLGLSADEHLLNLSPVIFDLMELDRSTPQKADAVQERYRQLIEQFIRTETDSRKFIQAAEQIYQGLIY
jgi:hypothetical protein